MKAISPSTLDSGQLQQLAIGLSRLMSEAPCFPEAVKTLKALDETHPLYPVTSNFTKAAQLFLDKHQLHCFRSIYGVDPNPNKNPSKVQKIQAIASKHPDQTLFYIGDTLGDLLEAKQAGVGAIAAGCRLPAAAAAAAAAGAGAGAGAGTMPPHLPGVNPTTIWNTRKICYP